MGIRSRCGCADCKEHRAWVTRAKASKLRLDDSLEFRMRTDYGNTIVSYPTTTTMFMLQGV